MTAYLITISALLMLCIGCLFYIASRMDITAQQARIINRLRKHVSPAIYQRVCQEEEK